MKTLREVLKATSLVRSGRIGEATSLLRTLVSGAPAADRSSPSARTTSDGHAFDEVVDLEPPAAAGGAWRLLGDRPDAAPDAAAPAVAGVAGLARGFGMPWPAGPAQTPPAPGGGRFDAHAYAGRGGTLAYKLFVPGGYAGAPLPLLVMLHGCTQSPDDFALGTGMNSLAVEHGFLVAYPQQTEAANPSRCWNWFRPGDQERESGEPALIAGATRQIMRDFAIDPARVFVAGLSAGGAAAAIMGAAYPDLFSGIGVHSGLPCGVAHDVASAFAAMKRGHGAPRGGRDEASRTFVRTIVFHGDKDKTVVPLNGDRVIAQAARDAGVFEERIVNGRAEGGLAYVRTVHADDAGNPMLEQWKVRGLAHAWSGGNPVGSYTDARGPDASREMLRFFLQKDRLN